MKTSEGNAVEGAVAGPQGFFGIPLVLEDDTSFAEAIIQVPGQAVRIPAAIFKEKIRIAPQLTKVLLRYAQFFYKESFISIGCNRFHSSEQRIARRHSMLSRIRRQSPRRVLVRSPCRKKLIGPAGDH